MIIPENINILIVDDNALVLKAYANVLSKRGYRVLTAGNGNTALDIISQEKISLILLDNVARPIRVGNTENIKVKSEN